MPRSNVKKSPDPAKSQTGETIDAPSAAGAAAGREAEAPVAPSREQLVREAAYRRFIERGAAHGHHEEDWLAAENEVRPPEGN